MGVRSKVAIGKTDIRGLITILIATQVTVVITHIRGLITILSIATHEPPRRALWSLGFLGVRDSRTRGLPETGLRETTEVGAVQ